MATCRDCGGQIVWTLNPDSLGGDRPRWVATEPLSVRRSIDSERAEFLRVEGRQVVVFDYELHVAHRNTCTLRPFGQTVERRLEPEPAPVPPRPTPQPSAPPAPVSPAPPKPPAPEDDYDDVAQRFSLLELD